MKNELDILARKYGTDKCSLKHNYVKWYSRYFESIRNNNLNILEIGIQYGFSLLMWKEYFKNSNIFGIDRKRRKEYAALELKDIKYFIGHGSDVSFLSKVLLSVKGGFDIIIDDASHKSTHQISSFQYLFPHLNKGGIYVIEDLHPSYWSKYILPEISSVDFLKNIIDDVNFHGKNRYQNFDIINENYIKNATEYEKTIESMHFYMGICFIFKR